MDNLQTQQQPGHRSVHHHPSQTAAVEDALQAAGKHERSGLLKDDDGVKKAAAGSLQRVRIMHILHQMQPPLSPIFLLSLSLIHI